MLRVPDIVRSNAAEILQQVNGTPIKILQFSPATGGCINNGGKITTTGGEFFIKWNKSAPYPGMFTAEATGLMLLNHAKAIRVPVVVGCFEEKDFQGIILEYISTQSRSSTYWMDLGVQLSNLHRNSSTSFGLDHSNYIGSLPQFNALSSSWIQFFIEQRLDVQLKFALDSGRLDADVAQQFHRLYHKLPSLLPDEKPALVHGDLWSGNVIVDENGGPCLIDPAVHYGNREAELSFTRLFGGFGKTFYDAYHESFALAPGFDARIDLYNLYPLMVHVNLFGEGYISQVTSVLKSYV